MAAQVGSQTVIGEVLGSAERAASRRARRKASISAGDTPMIRIGAGVGPSAPLRLVSTVMSRHSVGGRVEKKRAGPPSGM